MSDLVELILQVGDVLGWSFVLFVFFIYELYWPNRLHTSKTKIKTLLRTPSAVTVAALEPLYEKHDDLSREKLVEMLNGDTPRAYEFTVDDISEQSNGD